MLLAQVIEFGAILREVIEFPSTSLGCNHLPVALPQSPVRAEMLVKSLVAIPLSALEDGNERFALQRVNDTGPNLFGIGSLPQLKEGSHEIDQVAGLVSYGSVILSLIHI